MTLAALAPVSEVFMVRYSQGGSVLGEAHEYWFASHVSPIGKRGAGAGATLFFILRKPIS